jgi:hypothetical protein
MNYEDGVMAYSRRKSGEWQDKWMSKAEAEQSLETALAQL